MELLMVIEMLFALGAISFLVVLTKIALKGKSKTALRKIEDYELFLNQK